MRQRVDAVQVARYPSELSLDRYACPKRKALPDDSDQ
jgi:hypothetical protein